MPMTCPHCSTVFDAPSSGAQFCPACGKTLTPPQAVQPPPSVLSFYTPGQSGGAPAPPAPGREDTAWEHLSSLGFLGAFGSTWADIMFRPQVFWPKLKPDGKWVYALSFAWIIAVIHRLFS